MLIKIILFYGIQHLVVNRDPWLKDVVTQTSLKLHRGLGKIMIKTESVTAFFPWLFELCSLVMYHECSLQTYCESDSGSRHQAFVNR